MSYIHVLAPNKYKVREKIYTIRLDDKEEKTVEWNA